MTLITSKGNTYSVRYVDGPTQISGTVLARIYDSRRLPQIAAEFDGLKRFSREDENQGDKEWTGYTMLYSIRRMAEGEVLVELARP